VAGVSRSHVCLLKGGIAMMSRMNAARTLTGSMLAWVLWMNEAPLIGVPELGEWKPKDTFESKPECDTALQREVRGLHKTIRSVAETGGNVQSPSYSTNGATILLKVGGSLKIFTFTYQCFPDSIDPRKK
jgi:hypothetical protein